MKYVLALAVMVVAAESGVMAQTETGELEVVVPVKVAEKSKEVKVQVHRDMAYVKDGDKAQMLDLHLPKSADGKPLPVVVWVHGGGWKQGSKSSGPFAMLTANGYAVASVEYRFSNVATFPAQIQDCQAALRWLRANSERYNLDKRLIAVWGSSAGGHLVTLMGTAGGKGVFKPIGGNEEESDAVAAVVDFFGPANLNTLREQAKADIKSIRPQEVSNDNASLMLGANIGEDKEKSAAGSPIHYVSKDCPPFLIMHGDGDHTVPLAQSVEFYEALKKAGVEATFEKVAGAGHGGSKFATPEAQKGIVAFLDKHLKGMDVKVEAVREGEVKKGK